MNDRERTFKPDYGVDGPYDGGPWKVSGFALVWARRGAVLIIVAFLLGFLGRHFGVL